MFMNYSLCVFVVRVVHFVNGDIGLTTPEIENSSETNKSRLFLTPNGESATIPQGTMQDESPNFEETSASDTASNLSPISNVKHQILGQYALSLLRNISRFDIVKPIQEQVQRFKDFINHPNNAHISIPLLNPFQILNALQQKGNNFLSGINGALFGMARPENYDYPFPYRRAELTEKKEDKANK